MWSMPLKAIVSLLAQTPPPGGEAGGLSLALPLRSHGRARDPLPALESVSHLLAILGGGELVASRSEVLSDGTIRGEETLRGTRRFKPWHASFPMAGRLVGVLRTIVEIPRCCRRSTLGSSSRLAAL
jgi:hypothetical protein